MVVIRSSTALRRESPVRTPLCALPACAGRRMRTRKNILGGYNNDTIE